MSTTWRATSGLSPGTEDRSRVDRHRHAVDLESHAGASKCKLGAARRQHGADLDAVAGQEPRTFRFEQDLVHREDDRPVAVGGWAVAAGLIQGSDRRLGRRSECSDGVVDRVAEPDQRSLDHLDVATFRSPGEVSPRGKRTGEQYHRP